MPKQDPHDKINASLRLTARITRQEKTVDFLLKAWKQKVLSDLRAYQIIQANWNLIKEDLKARRD